MKIFIFDKDLAEEGYEKINKFYTSLSNNIRKASIDDKYIDKYDTYHSQSNDNFPTPSGLNYFEFTNHNGNDIEYFTYI